MKYLPLVWAALSRKPAESILTCLAVTVAFALFGLMMGTRTTYQHVIEAARMDRLYVNSATGAQLPIHLNERLIRFDGVTGVGAFDWLGAYYRNPTQSAAIWYVDQGMQQGWSELESMNPARWAQLFANPAGVFVSSKTATRLSLNKGASLPVIARSASRADGDKVWNFEVLGVVPEDPSFNGVIIANYHYVDAARAPSEQGMVGGFRVAVRDPARASAIALQIDRYFANSDTATLSVPARTAAENMARSTMDMATQTLYISAAGLFMVVFVTANGIAQSVRERIPEFAVLKTMGFAQLRIVALVFAEAAAQCLPGALFGMLLACVLSRWPVKFLPSQLGNMPVPTLSVAVLIWALFFAIVLAIASAVVPVIRLRKLRVAEALAGK